MVTWDIVSAYQVLILLVASRQSEQVMKFYLLGRSTKLIDIFDRLLYINNGEMPTCFPVFLRSSITLKYRISVSCTCITKLRPQSPRHFARQASARISCYLSHTIAATM